MMRLLIIVGIVLLSCVGCGGDLSIATVSGTVTFEGKPLVGASITTQPIGVGTTNPGPGSFGRTDEQGRYVLELVTPARKGAIIGEHRVMISRGQSEKSGDQRLRSAGGESESSGDDPQGHRAGMDSKWPRRFIDGTLRLHVPAKGTDAANFDLTAKP